jgi:hypothetical protein
MWDEIVKDCNLEHFMEGTKNDENSQTISNAFQL